MLAMRPHVPVLSRLWLAAALAVGAAAGLAAQAASSTPDGPKMIALLRADDEWTLREAMPRSAVATIAAAPAERLERATGL